MGKGKNGRTNGMKGGGSAYPTAKNGQVSNQGKSPGSKSASKAKRDQNLLDPSRIDVESQVPQSSGSAVGSILKDGGGAMVAKPKSEKTGGSDQTSIGGFQIRNKHVQEAFP